MSRKKGKKGKRSGLSRELVAQQIEIILSGNPGQGFNYKQLSKRLNITDMSERQMVLDVLNDLAAKGRIKEIYNGKFSRGAAVPGYVTGTVDMTRMGYGFITSPELEDDIFISANNLRTALHGDKVKVRLYAK
ncbi:MAG: hypothetical protein JXR66_08285, partial [Bacteroidales bacterium]|nr:hypothetical protein [Bacteroidales bacterium]